MTICIYIRVFTSRSIQGHAGFVSSTAVPGDPVENDLYKRRLDILLQLIVVIIAIANKYHYYPYFYSIVCVCIYLYI